MMDLHEFQEDVREWSQQNFGGRFGSGYRPLLGVAEEVGELCHAHLKEEQGIRSSEDHHANKIDAIGDIVIYLADYCTQQGIDLTMAVDRTWQDVKKRDWKAIETAQAAGGKQ